MSNLSVVAPTIVEHTLKLLNDVPNEVYAFTYDFTSQTFKVLKLVEVEHHTYKDKILYRLVPVSVSHQDLATALKDGILLKVGGSHKIYEV